MKNWILPLALILFCLSANAQERPRPERPQGDRPRPERPEGRRPRINPEDLPAIGTLSGRVLDAETHKPVEYATIALIRRRTGQLESGTVTDGRGRFVLEHLKPGFFRLEVSFIGYQTLVKDSIRITPRQPVVELGDLLLHPESQTLEEVVVREHRPIVEQRIDKRVVRVDQMVGSESISATEILENVPSVQVDIDGNISLRGSQNLRILIDGRPTLGNEEAAQLLQQLPGNAIDRIEIITSPSAKYDPEGMAGILNIILKKEEAQGHNGSVSLGLGTLPEANGGLNASLRRGDWRFFGQYNGRWSESATSGETNARYFVPVERRLDQTSDGTHAFGMHMARAGFDWSLNKYHTLGMQASLRQRGRNGTSETLQTFWWPDGELLARTLSTSSSRHDHLNYDLNAHHKVTFTSSQHYLSTDLTWSRGEGLMESTVLEDSLDLSFAPYAMARHQRTQNDQRNEEIRLRLDYAQPFGKQALLEAGFHADWRRYDGSTRIAFSPDRSEAFVLDPTRSNDFLYDENIYATYVSYGRQWERFSAKAGLRAEHVVTHSMLEQTQETFDLNYQSLYPSLHLQYKLPADQELTFGYSRRVRRPRARQINPFTDYSNPYMLRTGNPFLRPEYSHVAELSWQRYFKTSNVGLTLYYRQTNDAVQRIIKPLDELVSIATYENAGMQRAWGAEWTFGASLWRWWRLQGSFDVSRAEVSGDSESIEFSNEATVWSGRLSQTFRLPANLTLQLNTRYRGPRVLPQGTMEGIFMADIGLRMQVLQNKGTLSLRVRDPLNTMRFEMHTADSRLEQDLWRRRISRSASLSFTYRFGNMQNGERMRRNRRNNGEEEEPDMEEFGF